MYGRVWHESGHVFESVGHGQPAMTPKLHVSGQPEVPASLYVERHQVETEPFAGLLHQVVGHFLRDRVVHSLGHLVHKTHQILVYGTRSVQVKRSTDQV